MIAARSEYAFVCDQCGYTGPWEDTIKAALAAARFQGWDVGPLQKIAICDCCNGSNPFSASTKKTSTDATAERPTCPN